MSPAKISRFFQRLAQTFQLRADWALLGIYYGRTSTLKPHPVRVADQITDLKFLEGEEEDQYAELGSILTADCYGLRELVPSPPATVLDIGGNSGLFSLVARARFPKSTIHCYEPSPTLAPILEHNLRGLDVTVHHEGVGADNARSRMVDRGPSATGMTIGDPDGDIQVISFDTAIERIGGSVDLVKLDCEGAEWGIFKNTDAWANVKNIALEYHLWAGDHSLGELLEILLDLGFHIEHFKERQTRFNGLLWASRGVQGKYGTLTPHIS